MKILLNEHLAKDLLALCANRGVIIQSLQASLSAKNAQIDNLEHCLINAGSRIADLEYACSVLSKQLEAGGI